MNSPSKPVWTTRWSYYSLLVLTLTLLGAVDAFRSAPLSGQADSGAFVAIADAFPPIDAKAMVIREPGIDLVVLREGDVTVDALTMALHVLRDARARVPTPTTGYLIPITGFVVERAVEGPARRALEETLRRLEGAASVNLGSLGSGRRVRLPGR
ncbi:MAG: hypothetical protein R3253_13600 [Longimicrobiales bacterium]|nr:hypothetical protein [Longimicrobiales bacterium]